MKKNIIITLLVLAILIIAGYFFISKKPSVQENNPAPQGKIDINAVCEGSLAYMTFPDGASAEKFVAECKEGKQPQVIEDFKVRMNLGDGAAI